MILINILYIASALASCSRRVFERLNELYFKYNEKLNDDTKAQLLVPTAWIFTDHNP